MSYRVHADRLTSYLCGHRLAGMQGADDGHEVEKQLREPKRFQRNHGGKAGPRFHLCRLDANFDYAGYQ